MSTKKKLIVVGNGMTGYKFCEKFIEKGLSKIYDITVFGEEPWAAYDRVHLTDYYTGTSVRDLKMAPREWYEENGIELRTSYKITSVDRDKKIAYNQHGDEFTYDTLVLSTGSDAFVPPIPGVDKKGVFVYRRIEDLDAIKEYVTNAKSAAVIGGGLLGLEAAKAVMDDGLKTSVVEFAPRLMPRQLDDDGSNMLKSELEKLDLDILLSKNTKSINGNGKVTAMEFADGSILETDMVVVSAGIRPRDELARECGLTVGERGGILVDETMRTSDPSIFAIGECALALGSIWGLVAPCYDMADVCANNLLGEEAKFEGADLSTKLKLIGIEVASFGDAFGVTEGAKPIVFHNIPNGIYKKIFISEDGKHLLGGILVGDAEDYNMLYQTYASKIKLPANPEGLIIKSDGGGFELSVLDLPDEAVICSCENVTKKSLIEAVDEFDFTQVGQLKKATKAGTGCGGCVPMLDDLLTAKLEASGKVVKKVICEHFDYTRQELFDLIKVEEIKTYPELLKKHGTGSGCEICKPLSASLLASIWNEHITKHSNIQDTNDKFLANIQKGGTYSVVPRIAGGEITPDKLIVIGQVAKKYDLYTKITGGQRIDLFGAKVEELPEIWKELIEAGFESGHAYGKSLRTVKSCVGSTWCRYGQQDSVSFALKVENRYKGLRSPHKLKGGVSGCIRECAEARGKDFGIIATDKGYNLLLCGNGGANPKHALLFATDLDEETCIKYLDRFLMFYIKTAAPLTRTAKWLDNLDGGIDYLKEVVIEDSLGICEQLDKDMEKLVDTYACEWKKVVEDPEMIKKFRPFVNSDATDDSIKFTPMREMKKPANW
ncbi:nitrite reductase large subunit NirB [Labilibacter marinus]|uniref:nitrite reductase large subunit NirB n=1 Tax=Labilibacter marinus TaxID=1477105 RepID=UPI00094FE168|nr:nitrite reductase large subunit NirB [Labilibacter marinus]